MTSMSMGLVSVIMPFYNAHKYLDEAIESVQAQTYPHWELLLIDDGSEDGSADVAAARYRRDLDRIRLLTYTDGTRGPRGASAARNLGLAHSRGEFIAFLDADDVWLPQKLAEEVALLRARPDADLVYGRTLFWHSWTGRAEDADRDRIPRLRVPVGTTVRPPDLLTACLTGRAAVPCTCSILIRRQAVEAAGGFEERFRRIYTDQAFYSKLLLRAAALPVEACWDKYRQHPESSSAGAKQADEGRTRRRLYLDWLAEYVREHAPGHRRLNRAIRRERWRTDHPAADGFLDRLEYVRRRVTDTLAVLLRLGGRDP